ncbi:MAG: phage Gp37/Gp68 family protein [Desulfovibrio sp.]
MPSKIEWTEETWNPSVGCTKISSGCQNCYAEVMAKRLQSMGLQEYRNGFKFTLLPQRLEQPLKVKRPTLFFVNSMSDLFHDEMPNDFIDDIFNTIIATPQHRYQILTKRSARMLEYFLTRDIPRNTMIGATVEDKIHGLPRIADIRQITNAPIRFLSIEPLLENLGTINLTNIDWVIVGGESGSRARPMQLEWVTTIREQCLTLGIPFYFKQWGTWGEDGVKRSKKKNGRLLEGKIWEQMPD